MGSDVSEETHNVSQRVKILTLKNKEDQAEQILKILVEGASHQLNYMRGANDYMEINTNDDEKSFIDI